MQHWPNASADRLIAARWAGDVADWSAATDAADVADARLINYRLRFSADPDAPVLIGVASLRNLQADR